MIARAVLNLNFWFQIKTKNQKFGRKSKIYGEVKRAQDLSLVKMNSGQSVGFCWYGFATKMAKMEFDFDGNTTKILKDNLKLYLDKQKTKKPKVLFMEFSNISNLSKEVINDG